MKLKRGIISVAIVVASTLVGLLLAEFSVRLLFPQNRMVTWLEMHPRGFMMNQEGGTAFQEFGERRADYRFTENRFRGEKVSANSKTILTIGDSFTFGLLLNEEDTFAAHLQNKIKSSGYNDINLINGGVGGAGLADWPGWLQEVGATAKPDVILYFMNVQDVDRALSKNLFVLRDDSLLNSRRWKPNESMTKLGRKSWYRWLQAHSDLANYIVRLLWRNYYFEDVTHNFNPDKSSVPIPNEQDFSLNSEYSLKLANAILAKMDNWCAQNNCELIVATTGFFEADADSNFNHTYKLYHQLNKAKADSSLPFIFEDNTACIDSAADGNLEALRIPIDNHPNEKGAELVATCSWNWLEQEVEKLHKQQNEIRTSSDH